MCFGTFDLLHLGHLDYFKQAKQYGDYLIVVIARDKTKQDQQKSTVFSEEERLKLIHGLKVVDEVVLGNQGNHYKIIQEKQPDLICLGYDHPISEKDLAEALATLGIYPQIKRMKPYQADRHKTTLMKKIIEQI